MASQSQRGSSSTVALAAGDEKPGAGRRENASVPLPSPVALAYRVNRLPRGLCADIGGSSATLGVEDAVGAIASQAGKSGLRFLDRTGGEVRWCSVPGKAECTRLHVPAAVCVDFIGPSGAHGVGSSLNGIHP